LTETVIKFLLAVTDLLVIDNYLINFYYPSIQNVYFTAGKKAPSEQSSRFEKFFQQAATDCNQLRKISSARKQQLDEAFFKMLVLDYQPLTIGERAGMRHFANCLVPGYVTPRYATVRDTLLPTSMKNVGEMLMKLLAENNNFAVATDIWTSRRGTHLLLSFAHSSLTSSKVKPFYWGVRTCLKATLAAIFETSTNCALSGGTLLIELIVKTISFEKGNVV
jgi:hypothetical protein